MMESTKFRETLDTETVGGGAIRIQKKGDQTRLLSLGQSSKMDGTWKVPGRLHCRWMPRPEQRKILQAPCQVASVKGGAS